MVEPRIITSEKLIRIAWQQWKQEIEPNSVNVIDHYVKLKHTVRCKVLCRYRNSDEAHEHIVEITHECFDALPTADEFAAQLQRESEIDETN